VQHGAVFQRAAERFPGEPGDSGQAGRGSWGSACAVLNARIGRLARAADALGDADDPGAAFLAFFTGLIEHALANKALIDALGGTAHPVSDAKRDLLRAGGVLLARAQEAGAIRADLDADDLQALVTGCLEMERRARESGRPGRMLALMQDAIKPR
jgi:hypothetical protein